MTQLYAQYMLRIKKNLQETKGWKIFKGITNRQKKIFRLVNQAKLRYFRLAPKYKYWFQVPRNYKHATTTLKKKIRWKEWECKMERNDLPWNETTSSFNKIREWWDLHQSIQNKERIGNIMIYFQSSSKWIPIWCTYEKRGEIEKYASLNNI